MQFKKWQVKCLILFIYCHYISAVSFTTLWKSLVLVQRGERKSVCLPTHRPMNWFALLELDLEKKACKAYLPSVLKSAGTNKWDPPHIPICSGFYNLLVWTQWSISAALQVLPAQQLPLLLGKQRLFHRHLQGASETNQGWPAPG